MTDEGDYGGGEVDVIATGVARLGAQRPRNLGIPGGQVLVAGDAGEADHLRSAPAARPALLFERLDRQQASLRIDLEGPQQAGRFTAGVAHLRVA